MSMSTSRCSSAWPCDHRRCGWLSRHQDPRAPRHSPARSPPAQRQSSRRLDGKADPPRRLTSFHLSESTYGLNQLRYDLRKLKGHGLLQRDGSRYAYRLTPKGVQVALLLLFFHKRLCGPLANSRFHHRPDPAHQPASKLEAAYHRADKAIQHVVDLLAA